MTPMCGRCGHHLAFHRTSVSYCEVPDCPCAHFRRNTTTLTATDCDLCGALTTRAGGICLLCEDDSRVGFTMPGDRHDLPTRADRTEIPS